MKATTWRKVWAWHLWIGVAFLAPMVFWLGTALVFALWPIEIVRGKSLSTGRSAEPIRLQPGMVPPPEALDGALQVIMRSVEGRLVALVDRGTSTEVWDLRGPRNLGPSLPLEWVRDIARRDFGGEFEEEAVYLYPRTGLGRRVAGRGPDVLELPGEYSGPRPAYAFHLREASMHLYVDALSGDVRARRRGHWRTYDFAFRLHSLEFISDGAKRSVMIAVLAIGFVLSITGLMMAVKRLRPQP